MSHDLPTTVVVSPDRLRRMGADMIRLATYLDDLDKRELPYRVDGGLVMSTTNLGDTDITTFSIHGTLDVHVTRAPQEDTHG